jgi:hypothetical protein
MAKATGIKLLKPSKDQMCPPGHHVVRGHERVCHSGTRTWVDVHVRKNRGSIPNILLIENIHYIYWGSNKKYESIGKIDGFPETAELDPIIQFWLDYWKNQGLKVPDGFDPLLIKTMIAIESSFDPSAKTKIKGSSATGLMQLTDETRNILSGRLDKRGYRELKSNYFEISKTDVQDPVVAVAAGIRWFAHKFAIIPKSAKKSLHNSIKSYHSWDSQGEAYAQSVEVLYKKSKKTR